MQDHPSPKFSSEFSSTFNFRMMASPVGELKLIASQKGLAGVLWGADDRRLKLATSIAETKNEILEAAEAQLKEYFARKRRAFDLPLDFIGTEFQKSVWNQLLQIPFGETKTYGAIANELGNSKAVRAVGAANGQNPISIIAPCHRVIGASGKLTGFAGGLEAKSYLLNLERQDVKQLSLELLG